MRPDMRAEEEEAGDGRGGQERRQREGRRGVWEPGVW